MSSDDIPVFHLKPSLIDLIKRGESGPVIHYLEKHPDEINRADDNGFFPIHHAIQEKQEELITILLEYGASVEVNAPQHVSIPMLATLHGMAATFPVSDFDESILSGVDDGGNTLCHYLAFNGDVNQWKLFNIRDREITGQNNSGKSPLQLLIEEGNNALFSLILNKKPVQKELHTNADKYTHICIRSGCNEMLNVLLAVGDRSEERWNDLIEQCCVLEKPACSRLVLDWGKEREMRIDAHRIKAVPSGLITPEISTILGPFL